VGALVLGLIGTILFAIGEARQRGEAEHNARQALFQAYRARIAAAVAALSASDVADAARQLDAAPEELRDWEWRHLQSRLDDSSAVVRVRTGDHALLLGGPEGLRVWHFTAAGLRFTDESGNESPERPFPDLKGFVSGVGSASRWLLAEIENSRLTLRDETGRVTRMIKLPSEAQSPLVLSPDGTRLAVTLFTNRRGVAIYDTSTGKEQVSLVNEAGVYALAFSPDGQRLAIGGDGRVVRIVDTATGKHLPQCQGHTSKILAIAFRGDGRLLVTGSHDGTVRQWDAQTGREVEPPYRRHTAEVSAAAYSPDGQRVASAGADRTVRLWQSSGQNDDVVLLGHSGAISELVFSRDGRHLVSSSFGLPTLPGDGAVRFWEAAPDATLPVLRGHTDFVYPVVYSPDGRWIASGSWDNWVRLWDAGTGAECAKLPQPGVVQALAFTPDGAHLVSAGQFNGDVLIWDISTAHLQGRLAYGKDLFVASLAISPDGTRIAVGTYKPIAGFMMRISDIATGKEIAAAEGTAFAFSPAGTRLAGVNADRKTVVLWDAQTFLPVAQWKGHTADITNIAFDRTGGRLVSVSIDRTVRLWDVATGRCLRVLEGHTDDIFAAAFHPDGRRLATAGRDRAIWLWDLTRNEEVARLPGHTSYVWSLAWSPDGNTLVSGSGDFTVRLWDTSPLKTRYQARREAESLGPEAKRLVDRLLAEKTNVAKVADALGVDPSLSAAQKRAAFRALLRHCATHNE
jgi:WD40 repeat protein